MQRRETSSNIATGRETSSNIASARAHRRQMASLDEQVIDVRVQHENAITQAVPESEVFAVVAREFKVVIGVVRRAYGCTPYPQHSRNNPRK